MAFKHMRGMALSAAFALLALQQTAAVTLNLNGFSGQTISNANWSMTSYTPVAIPAISGDFTAAFNSWNTAGWTINNAGALNGTFKVTDYTPKLVGATGDLSFNMTYTAGAGDPSATANNTVWAQSISTNAKLAGSLPGNPYLDNPAGSGGFAPPAYPFQYADGHFYDDPSRTGDPTKTIYWTADVYLCVINYNFKTLNVYDGVEWGFQISPKAPPPVPEPAPLAALGLGVVGLAVRRRKLKA